MKTFLSLCAISGTLVAADLSASWVFHDWRFIVPEINSDIFDPAATLWLLWLYRRLGLS